LWKRTHFQAGIERDCYFKYFAGLDVGHAIVIGAVRRYRRARDLSVHYGVRPPQSFLYI
jgi:predicted transcriptional regulator